MEHVSIRIVWRLLKGTMEYLKMCFFLPKKIDKAAKEISEIKAQLEKPISPDAKFCASCDTRMKFERISAGSIWYVCPACSAVLPVKY